MSESMIQTIRDIRDRDFTERFNRLNMHEIMALLAAHPFAGPFSQALMSGDCALSPMTLDVLNDRFIASTAANGPMSSPHEALGVLTEEVHELVVAIHQNDTQATYAEMADVANTCIRWMQEMERRGLV